MIFNFLEIQLLFFITITYALKIIRTEKEVIIFKSMFYEYLGWICHSPPYWTKIYYTWGTTVQTIFGVNSVETLRNFTLVARHFLNR